MTHSLIASINYATDSLGLYRAELARILGLMCSDVGDSLQLDNLLNHNAETSMRAQRFVIFFSRLENLFNHDHIKMVHWFRAENKMFLMWKVHLQNLLFLLTRRTVFLSPQN